MRYVKAGELRGTGLVRRLVEPDRSVSESFTWLGGLLIVPTAIRASVDTGALGLPFITYWPSLLICSLALEARYAVAFALVAAITAQRLFGGGAWFEAVTAARVVFFVLFALSGGLIIATGATLRGAMRAVSSINAQQEHYNRELRHRVRNMLTLIQALASRGPRAASPLDFYKEFSQRIDGLAAASDLLQIGAEAEGKLPDLVRSTTAPFDRDGRIRLTGEPCRLPTGSCIPLIMALHELCTNAVKHGALSNDSGYVEVNWFIGAEGQTLYLLWTERGGPKVQPPAREGLGTRLLMPQPGIEGLELNFEPDGVWCEMRINGAQAITG